MTRPLDALRDGPILLYDGNCGVCSRAVQWVLAHERYHFLRFAPLESAIGHQLRSLGGVAPEEDSMLWTEIRDGRVRADIRSAAVLRVLAYGGRPLALVLAVARSSRFPARCRLSGIRPGALSPARAVVFGTDRAATQPLFGRAALSRAATARPSLTAGAKDPAEQAPRGEAAAPRTAERLAPVRASVRVSKDRRPKS